MREAITQSAARPLVGGGARRARSSAGVSSILKSSNILLIIPLQISPNHHMQIPDPSFFLPRSPRIPPGLSKKASPAPLVGDQNSIKIRRGLWPLGV